MTLAEVVLTFAWVGVTLYALFAGADFGGGVWDLVAGDAVRGARARSLIEHSMGPIWEANHVWLIFVLVVLWTGFPTAFAAIMSTLFVPLTVVAFGIILRGSGFALRKVASTVGRQRIFGGAFALASLVTPFFLGTVAGAVASGRVPAEGVGDSFSSWVHPTSLLGGALAVVVCAYLAAVFLCRDAERAGHPALAEEFRIKALASGIAAGVVALGGIAVLEADAPKLSDGLLATGLPLVLISAAAGAASLFALWKHRFRVARVAAGAAVAAVIWGWAAGQHPWLLEGEMTIEQGAGNRATLTAVVWALVIGAAIFTPPLAWLLREAQRGHLSEPSSLDALVAKSPELPAAPNAES